MRYNTIAGKKTAWALQDWRSGVGHWDGLQDPEGFDMSTIAIELVIIMSRKPLGQIALLLLQMQESSNLHHCFTDVLW